MKKALYYLVLFNVSLLFSQTSILTEEVLIMNDSIQLPGTLTFDSSLKTQPLVIFIHGSGNVDRNGNQAGMPSQANYIHQLSDSLTQRGIAFYRYDKRTATMENIKFLMSDLYFERFVDDAVLAVDKFHKDPRFSSISLIGHSQGSLVAMLVSEKTKIDKYISLAGPSKPFDELIISQIRKQNGDSIANIADNHFKQLKETGNIKNMDPNLAGMFNPANQTFFTSWMAYNPTVEIKKLKMPILIINGDKDLQVFVEDANNLHEANANSEVLIIEKMNHVLKIIETDADNIPSYSSPDYPLSMALLKGIETFIKK
ncbi:MAG: alpha/beta hydrolase family protein [Aquaticitalea sp.]